MTSCPIGRHTTGTTQNQDSVEFDSTIGSTTNPFENFFTHWNVSQSALVTPYTVVHLDDK